MNQKFYKKKSLGQNFLINKGILKIIAKEANIVPGEIILEVGPGNGTLTEMLLANGAKIIAIEKDDRLIPILEKKFENETKRSSLKLIHGDVLDLDIKNITHEKNYKVVANIPYYITGSLIRLLLTLENPPSTMILMLQKEVAKRIVAHHGKESLISLSVKAYGIPKYVKTISPGSFSPPPSVDSAILSITNISKDFFKDIKEEKFFEILRAGFSSKRKKLLSNLSTLFPKNELEQAFFDNSIDLSIRAENLSINDWFSLVKALHKSSK